MDSEMVIPWLTTGTRVLVDARSSNIINTGTSKNLRMQKETATDGDGDGDIKFELSILPG
eukprot:2301214-Rhodomonas_salina.1